MRNLRDLASVMADSSSPNTILVAEDSEDDAMLLRYAFERFGLDYQLHIVSDGREAVDYLKESIEAGSLPKLILLDINMPRMDGFEVLEVIKKDDRFRAIPTIVLTSSPSRGDIDKSYENGANTFISKPTGFEDFEVMVTVFGKYWTGVAKLPTPIDSEEPS